MSIQINGTTGISGVDGSASAPALQGTDSNTGINFGSDTVNINTGGVTRATIDSSGNMLIGATSASGKLHVEDSGENNVYFVGNTSTSGSRIILQNKNTTANSYTGLLGADAGGQTTSQILFYNADNANNEGYMTFETRPSGGLPTERMRINSTGVFQLGQNTTNTVGYGNTTVGFTILPDGRFFSSMGSTFSQINRNSTGTVLSFAYQSTGVGQVSIGTNSTSYGTSSDYRLKENVVAISDGITRLKTLKPYRFNFKGSSDVVDGFFAHEVTAVPEAITGTKDEVDSDNNPVYQGIDQSKLVPLLTAALQEAIAKIEVLETENTQMKTDLTALTARVTALEAG